MGISGDVPKQKGVLSRIAKGIKEGIKGVCTKVAGKVLRKWSFPLFGIPAGLESGLEGGGIKTQLYPPLALAMRRPMTIDDRLYWSFQANLGGMVLPEEGVLVIPEGLATNKGGNLSLQGKLITTFLQPIDAKPPHKNDLFNISSKRFFPKIYESKYPVVN